MSKQNGPVSSAIPEPSWQSGGGQHPLQGAATLTHKYEAVKLINMYEATNFNVVLAVVRSRYDKMDLAPPCIDAIPGVGLGLHRPSL